MLRLRTTSGLSMLALLIGIAGTGWLSSLTADWNGPPAGLVTTARRVPTEHRWHGPIHVVSSHHLQTFHASNSEAAPALTSAMPALIPLSMPADHAQAWEQVRGHLDGHLVLHLDIDADGHVAHARLLDSSGDPVLDAYALHNVHDWRFAVPADHPAGISGDLPMYFSSSDERIAQAH